MVKGIGDIIMKKYIKTIIAIVAAFIVGQWYGSHNIWWVQNVRKDGSLSWYYPYVTDVRDELAFEREYCNALFEGLHRFYSNDDNDFWFESFVYTNEYQKIDSINGGDWEDFYYYETPILENWESVYGYKFEPTEQEKDSLIKIAYAKCNHK